MMFLNPGSALPIRDVIGQIFRLQGDTPSRRPPGVAGLAGMYAGPQAAATPPWPVGPLWPVGQLGGRDRPAGKLRALTFKYVSFTFEKMPGSSTVCPVCYSSPCTQWVH